MNQTNSKNQIYKPSSQIRFNQNIYNYYNGIIYVQNRKYEDQQKFSGIYHLFWSFYMVFQCRNSYNCSSNHFTVPGREYNNSIMGCCCSSFGLDQLSFNIWKNRGLRRVQKDIIRRHLPIHRRIILLGHITQY